MSVATLDPTTVRHALSGAARDRFLEKEGRPLFLADWVRAVFVHYEVEPGVLQRQVPFELDLFAGTAFVSLVAFTMRRLRLTAGSRIGRVAGRLVMLPGANHGLLNVRTYVRHRGQPGIFFMSEWIPNALSVFLGPRTFGLPYRLGSLDYRHDHEGGGLRGTVTSRRTGGRVSYAADLDPATPFEVCPPGSRAEFLLERYSAFTRMRRRSWLFRIWHPPWPQTPVDLTMLDESGLRETGPWFGRARRIAANYTAGVRDVWIGRPRSVDSGNGDV